MVGGSADSDRMAGGEDASIRLRRGELWDAVDNICAFFLRLHEPRRQAAEQS